MTADDATDKTEIHCAYWIGNNNCILQRSSYCGRYFAYRYDADDAVYAVLCDPKIATAHSPHNRTHSEQYCRNEMLLSNVNSRVELHTIFIVHSYNV